MGLLRSALLWGSRSAALRDFFPRYRFVRRAVTRFMPGEGIGDALAAAEVLDQRGVKTVLTHLGENLLHESEAETVASHYLDVLQRIQTSRLNCHVSVKLTQLGLDLSEDLCIGHLETIIRKAADVRNVVWIDMESSAYVDRTLNLFRRTRERYPNVGVCLQSYLMRTSADLDDLLPLSPSIRLVKGTYAEPRHIAYRSKKDVDESFYVLALRLLHAAQSGGARPGIATHDQVLLERIIRAAAAQGIPKDSYEIQMLYGIKREYQMSLANDGYRVRALISYGTFWFPWYMRRLAERPANLLFVVKNIFAK